MNTIDYTSPQKDYEAKLTGAEAITSELEAYKKAINVILPDTLADGYAKKYNSAISTILSENVGDIGGANEQELAKEFGLSQDKIQRIQEENANYRALSSGGTTPLSLASMHADDNSFEVMSGFSAANELEKAGVLWKQAANDGHYKLAA